MHIFRFPPIYYKDKVWIGGVKLSREYYRAYIILKQDTRGYSFSNKEPSGYCKIDAYGDKAKIQVYVQDLKPIPKEKGYKLSLLANLPTGPRIVPLESFYVDEKGKRDIKISVDRNNIGGSSLSIEQFEGAVISIEDPASSTVTPLVGFKKQPFAWRSLINTVKENIKFEAEEKTNKSDKEVNRTTKIEEPIYESIKKSAAAEKTEEAENIDVTQEIKVIQEQKEDREIEIKEEQAAEIIEQIEPVESIETVEVDEPIEAVEMDVEPSMEVAESNLEASEVTELLSTEEPAREGSSPQEENTDFFSFFTPDIHKEFPRSKPKKENYLNKILRENIRMNPFERNKEYMEWYRISYEELPMILNYPWRWYSNPYLLIGAKKYNHLLLGRNIQLNTYCLAVPDIYFPAAKEKAKAYGFNYFLCCRNTRPAPGEYGYWVMDLPPISFEGD